MNDSSLLLVVPRSFPNTFKGKYRQNNNKKVCFLNTESLVLNITCNDFRKRLRSKVVSSEAGNNWFFFRPAGRSRAVLASSMRDAWSPYTRCAPAGDSTTLAIPIPASLQRKPTF